MPHNRSFIGLTRMLWSQFPFEFLLHQWYHVCVSHSKSAVRLIVDGDDQGERVLPFQPRDMKKQLVFSAIGAALV